MQKFKTTQSLATKMLLRPGSSINITFFVMRFTFIKIPRHRRFQYDPIYYNPEKEKQKERERRIRQEMGMPVEEEKAGRAYADRIRGGMRRRGHSHFEVVRSERKKSNLRLIIILILLVVLFYYLLNSAYDWYEKFFM
jgi:hypothetical protein